MQETYLSKMWR